MTIDTNALAVYTVHYTAWHIDTPVLSKWAEVDIDGWNGVSAPYSRSSADTSFVFH